MELAGSGYLYNLSVLGAAFATVSALVTLLRQTMGGQMSNFDVYLLRNFVSAGLLVSATSIIPQLLSLLHFRSELVWVASSLATALVLSAFVAPIPSLRRKVTGAGMPFQNMIGFVLFYLAITLLIANAVVPVLRDTGLYALSLTIFLSTAMWSFVRRIGSLISTKPSGDWNPKLG